jgi:hypothetical protein
MIHLKDFVVIIKRFDLKWERIYPYPLSPALAGRGENAEKKE